MRHKEVADAFDLLLGVVTKALAREVDGDHRR